MTIYGVDAWNGTAMKDISVETRELDRPWNPISRVRTVLPRPRSGDEARVVAAAGLGFSWSVVARSHHCTWRGVTSRAKPLSL